MRNPLKVYDDSLLQLINQTIRNKFFDKFFYYFTNLGGATFVTGLTFAIILLGRKTQLKYLGIEAFLAQILTAFVVQPIKLILRRERPYNKLKGLNTFGIVMRDYSFPSGHTAASFSLAYIVTRFYPALYLPIYIYAFLIGISRIYLAVHYPTDVTAGAIIGSGVSALSHNLVYPFILTYFTF
ncbi:MAG: phosphatase PAP2 family protein [Tissierellia bacterium]|nr:phosphatase PAP2 family protein [Tissierellia bacterium]